MLAPIALFCFNRLDTLSRTVEALQNNTLASESELFIFSDGPRRENEVDNVTAVREYIHSISGFKSITIKESMFNKGLGNSIIAGVTEVVNKYGKIIVLEDDLVTAPFFLEFMNEALDFYENEPKVAGILGYTELTGDNLPETYFSWEVGCLGWGTWKRGWEMFEPDGNKLLECFKTQEQRFRFDINGTYPFYDMLKGQAEGKVDSWAIRWYASVFFHEMLGLHPGKNMVSHIGYQTGTHFSNGCPLEAEKLSSSKPRIEKIPLEITKETYRAYEQYHNWLFGRKKPSLKTRIKGIIRNLLPYGVVMYLRNRQNRK